MSSKPSPTLSPPPDTPPPSYTESLTAPSAANPILHRISTLITTHILPHLRTNNSPKTTLVLVPFDVTPLFPPTSSTSTSHKDAATPPPSSAYPGEKLVGFDADAADHPLLIRLSSTEGPLQFWRTAAVLRDLTAQLCREVNSMGYRIVVSRGSSSVGLEWQSLRRAELKSGEARVHVEVKEVCLRVENEMGLYETRSGIAVVVEVELGHDDDRNDEEGGFAARCL
ncbi:MAG: hypothetical protein LQ339_007124 [Xanthoria mediterranea]|nr:MAG: hypothetical protein LQ339_007124 [Xanthoria mediterranea]